MPDLAAVQLPVPCPAEPHVTHKPGNRGGRGPLRFGRRGLQKLHRAFGKTRNYRLNSPLTF